MADVLIHEIVIFLCQRLYFYPKTSLKPAFFHPVTAEAQTESTMVAVQMRWVCFLVDIGIGEICFNAVMNIAHTLYAYGTGME